MASLRIHDPCAIFVDRTKSKEEMMSLLFPSKITRSVDMIPESHGVKNERTNVQVLFESLQRIRVSCGAWFTSDAKANKGKVSGKTKKAKKNKGGLVDHYSRVWEYRQALLESIPVTNPLHYLEGDHRVVEDIDFEGVIYSEFCHIIRKLVIIAPEVADFQTEDDSSVEIPKISSDDPWLNKLVGRKLSMVLCGRNVSEGRCAGKRGKKDCDSTEGQSSKVKKKNNVSTGEPSQISKATKERWAKKKEEEKKSINSRRLNYNLGALVTYKWIAHHYAREIINNPWLSYKYMQNSIREKYLIDVSLGQCKKAKQCALFDHEGGLVDHYSRVWEYRQALLESIPGSTCHLDLEEKDDGLMYFKRMYICFLGLKAGWKDGCRKSGAACTIKEHFLQIMEQIKMLDEAAHKCFNSRILNARGKPLITMLEDIRIYLMQRVYYMNKQAMMLEDTITPSIRRQLENLKIAQRYRQLFPECLPRVACYLHIKWIQRLVVSQSFSKNKGIEAYQYGIRPVLGSKTWKPTSFPKPLPPLERKMHGRPRKQRIRHPIKNVNEISRVGRIIHCHKCWEAGHNKKSCKNPSKPKPPNFYQPTPTPEQASNTNEKTVYIIDPVLPKQKAPPSGVQLEAYANEFSEADFNKDFEDQIGIALTAKDSQVPVVIPTQHSQVQGKEPDDVKPSTTVAANKIKGKEPTVQPSTPADAKKKRGRPKKATTGSSLKPSIKADAKKTGGRPKKTTTEHSYGRIYYKNRGRYERIANQNKPFKSDKYGTGSTQDKAFSVN
ncbi:calcium/proton exchanger [Tanacetum coccineum]